MGQDQEQGVLSPRPVVALPGSTGLRRKYPDPSDLSDSLSSVNHDRWFLTIDIDINIDID